MLVQKTLKNAKHLRFALDFIGVRGMPERDIEFLGVMGWGLEAARRFFRRRRPPNFECLQHKNSYYVLSKNKSLSFWEKKAPAGALSPSTVL